MEQINPQNMEGTDPISVPSLEHLTMSSLYPINEKKDSDPNAYLIKNSRYLKRTEQDERLYKSPFHDDYLFPMKAIDLIERFETTHKLVKLFDPLADEVPLVRVLTTRFIRAQDEYREKMTIISKWSLQSEMPLTQAAYATDINVRNAYDRCVQLCEDALRIKEQIDHIRLHQNIPAKISRLITLSHEEFLIREIPLREYVLSPWLPEAAISMIFAPPGIGKSYLCLTVAGIIASGGQLFESSPWKAGKARKVLYIDGEMHEADLQTRIKKLMCSMNIPKDHLHYLNGSWQKDFLPDLSTPEGQALIDEIIRERQIEVVFLDNLSTLCRTGRENDADSWRPIQTWLLQLRWRGIAVVMVHHAGKSKDENGQPRQRGSSMKEVIAESIIVLKHPKDYKEEQGCIFELSFSKARGFYGAEAASLLLALQEKDGMFHWIDQKLAAKTYELVVELYIEGMTKRKDIAQALNISPQAVGKHLRNAEQKGDISSTSPD